MCTEISNHENNKEMGWPEKGGFCIKCDRGGGKVLVCSDSNCPIVVHEECMGCPAKFDDRGNFYCPYCLYRQANAESRKAREDAMLKKQALSRFLDNEVTNGDKLVQPSMGKSPSKRADKSSPEERTGFLQSKCNKVGEGMQTEHEPEVDNQQIDRDVQDRQEDGHLSEIPEREKNIRKKAKRVLAENEPEADDQQLDRDFEDHQEDGHLNEIPKREKKIRKKAKQMRAENETEVDDLRLDRGVEDHKKDDHLSEIPEREKKIRKKAKRVLAENEPEADDQQLDRDFEDHPEDGHLSEIPEREKKIRKKSKQMRAENETEVDDLQLERGIEDHKKDDHLTETPDREKKMRKKANQMLAENEPEVDDQLLDSDVENCQGDGHLREIPEREKTIMKKIAVQMKAGRKENEAGGGAETEQIQGKTHESAVPFANEEPESQLRMKGKRRDETGASTSREFEAVLRRSNHNMIKKPDRKKKIRAKAKQMLAENEPEVDDQLLDDVEDCHPREIPEREKNIMKKAAEQMKAGRKENEAGGCAEAEQMQGKTRESAVPFANEEPESQLRMKAKRRDETGASTFREFEAVLGRSNRSTETNEIEDQPLNSDSKRSNRTASSPKKVSGLTGETSSPDKLKQAKEYSPWQRNQFPNGRRQKLMWSTEEEEMLQEGVHKFSATANKNIPWRKILDFGRHVFHPTRMPADLKDKWRTLCFR